MTISVSEIIEEYMTMIVSSTVATDTATITSPDCCGRVSATCPMGMGGMGMGMDTGIAAWAWAWALLQMIDILIEILL